MSGTNINQPTNLGRRQRSLSHDSAASQSGSEDNSDDANISHDTNHNSNSNSTTHGIGGGGGGGGGGGDKRPSSRKKRNRVRLSCLECRRRKLSCDRGYPCERCLRSGTPDKCSYEVKALHRIVNGTVESDVQQARPSGSGGSGSGGGGGGVAAALGLSRYDGKLSLSSNDTLVRAREPNGVGTEQDRIKRLEQEVAKLKSLLQKTTNEGTPTLVENSPAITNKVAETNGVVSEPHDDGQLRLYPNDIELRPVMQQSQCGKDVPADGIRFVKSKEYKPRYLGPHSACSAFSALSGLNPFMRETADEWISPMHAASDNKDRPRRKLDREQKYLEPDPELEARLPFKGQCDALVAAYLDQFEQLHRIVHVPSFQKQYDKFWRFGEVRPAAMTALVLCMMAVSSCMVDAPSPTLTTATGMVTGNHRRAQALIVHVDEWHQRQSYKHRKLIHYQIACMLYLAKRVNTYKKKRSWINSGVLVREAICLGLHKESQHSDKNVSSPFHQEMRRRLWATMVEFDIQAAYDQGLPTLMTSVSVDVAAPRNIDDEDFDESSSELPESKPVEHYTASSYQHLSRQSIPLRLELSRIVSSNGSEDLSYEEVIRLTNEITQEIDTLPSWDTSAPMTGQLSPKPLLAYTLLHIQLRQYVITLNFPFLKKRKTHSKYQFSEVMFYNAARDMVLLHEKLSSPLCSSSSSSSATNVPSSTISTTAPPPPPVIRTLNFAREDALTLSVNLAHVTMLQPLHSTNMIMVNAPHTLRLMEVCLAMKEDRVLRCGNYEPWVYSIMCAVKGLLETHLGHKDAASAKSACAERFVNLHYRLMAGQEPPNRVGGLGGCESGVDGEGGGSGGNENPAVAPLPYMSQPGGFVTGTVNSIDNASGATTMPWWLPNADATMLQPPLDPNFNMDAFGQGLNEFWAFADTVVGWS